jgi:large subunit ribosomal protein L1
MKRSKNYREVIRKKTKETYSLEDAVGFLVENAKAKFDESVEMHIRLAIDPKKGDQQVRSSMTLPHGTGKERKVAVITSVATKEAKDAGANMVGGEEIIADIKSGKFFDAGVDVLVATPEMMPKLASVARILGPKGLMPNPKAETVTTKVAETVASLKKGKIQIKNDATGNVHHVIGKRSMGAEKITENAKAFLDAVFGAKPAGVKGSFVVKVSLCTTMSPSVEIEK